MKSLARRTRFRWLLLVAAWIGSGACANPDDAHLYQTQPFAPSFNSDDIANLNHMGAVMVDKGVNFAVYSEHATKLQLALFDDTESNRPTRVVDMTRIGNVWSTYVEGVGVGQAYGFIAWGPNWDYDPNWYCGSILGFKADVDADGNRFDPNKLLMDPYAREIHRDHDWSKGSTATGPQRAQCDYAAASKSLVIQSNYQWSDNEASWRAMRADGTQVGHRWQDLVVYEIHPKGFTADPASGVQHPGTYRGIGEAASYFKEMGINAVELMPVAEKPVDGGYWGYQTIGFFIPERDYANDKLRWGPVDEFKWMVDQLHQQGIEVIVDMVYNHTGEGGLWRQYIQDSFTPDPTLDPNAYTILDPREVAGLYSFRGLDNQAYYALNTDRGTYRNDTGVGNQTRPNYTPFRRLITDSLEYWVNEFHVDGFRFDLARILAEDDLTWNDDPSGDTVLKDIANDPVLQQYNTRLFAEPWRFGASSVGAFPASDKPGTAWAEWNGPFRDGIRSFWNGDAINGVAPNSYPLNHQAWDGTGADIGGLLFATPQLFSWNREPYHATNFLTVHDGFTLYDTESFDQKNNGCGPLDPACCPQTPGICDENSGEGHNYSRDWSSWPNAEKDWACEKDVAAGTQRSVSFEGKVVCSGSWNVDGQDSNWCGTQNPNKVSFKCTADHDWSEGVKRRMMRNMFVQLLMSQGTPLILGGDEWMRTQLGNNNAYTSGADNPYNWFAWGEWEVDPYKQRMHDFVRQLIELRSRHSDQVAPASYDQVASHHWRDNQGNEQSGGEWGSRHVALYYDDPSTGTPLYIIINGEDSEVDFNLPTEHAWNEVVDTRDDFDQPNYFAASGIDPNTSGNASVEIPVPVANAVYPVTAHSVVVLEASN